MPVKSRKEAVAGNDLVISLDRNIQEYAEQAARKVMEEKAGGKSLDPPDESAERGDLCLCQCAGI